jgi:Bacterial low temperature requirement A protein (LtrA)
MLELFFDPVFAVAVAELGEALLHDISAAGFAHFAVLFVPLLWAWVGYAFYADRFDTDDVVLRAAMLTAMLGVIWLAIEISSAFHSPAGAAYFAAAYATVRLVLVGLYLRADYHEPRARPLTRRYIAGFSLGAVPWIISVWRSPSSGEVEGDVATSASVLWVATRTERTPRECACLSSAMVPMPGSSCVVSTARSTLRAAASIHSQSVLLPGP